LRDTKKLYETAAKDFEYLLGQESSGILKRLEQGYAPIQNQHKMIAKYQREKEREDAEPEPVQLHPPLAGGGGYGAAGGRRTEAMPPAWDELFQGRNQALNLLQSSNRHPQGLDAVSILLWSHQDLPSPQAGFELEWSTSIVCPPLSQSPSLPQSPQNWSFRLYLV